MFDGDSCFAKRLRGELQTIGVPLLVLDGDCLDETIDPCSTNTKVRAFIEALNGRNSAVCSVIAVDVVGISSLRAQAKPPNRRPAIVPYPRVEEQEGSERVPIDLLSGDGARDSPTTAHIAFLSNASHSTIPVMKPNRTYRNTVKLNMISHQNSGRRSPRARLRISIGSRRLSLFQMRPFSDSSDRGFVSKLTATQTIMHIQKATPVRFMNGLKCLG